MLGCIVLEFTSVIGFAQAFYSYRENGGSTTEQFYLNFKFLDGGSSFLCDGVNIFGWRKHLLSSICIGLLVQSGTNRGLLFLDGGSISKEKEFHHGMAVRKPLRARAALNSVFVN